MPCKLQSILEASGLESPALTYHIPCMAHVIQLALGAFRSNLGIHGCTKSWESHECNQQDGENDSLYIGKIQRLWKEGNATINKLSAMKPGVPQVIEKVCISIYFETIETNLYMAANTCYIEYAGNRLLKRVLSASTCQSMNRTITYFESEDSLESNTGVASASLLIMKFTSKLLKNPKYSDYRLLLTGQDELTIIKYKMEVLRSFRY